MAIPHTLETLVTPMIQKYWYLKPEVYNGSEGFMNPVVPVVSAVAYLLAKPVVAMICKALGTTGKSSLFTLFVVLHNLALMVFSAVVWKESWTVVSEFYHKKGLMATYCDSQLGGGEMWAADMGRLAFLFYVSKYYEFLDTFVLLVKQKKVMVLQSYHHAGAVLTMFGLCYTQASSVLWFVCLNSMIHTFMYTYYALSACGIRLPGKSLITTCQIIQFLVGISCTVPIFVMKYTGSVDCQTDAQVAALVAVHLYVFPLIALFANFFIKSYMKKAPKQKKV